VSGIGVRGAQRLDPPDRSGLRVADVARLAVAGLRGKPVRAVLSALGVALGVATMVAVLGISASSRAQLVAEIDSLGTNMLTAQPSSLLGAQNPTLPAAAPAMAARIGPVISVGTTGAVNASIYKSDRIPAANTEAIGVDAATPGLLGAVEGHLYRGRFLNAATSRYPAVVLGSDAASALGIDQPGTPAWLGGRWFTVVGIMQPNTLASELDRAALIGFAQASRLAGHPVLPTELYVRTYPQSTNAVGSVLAATVDPASPQDVQVTNPTDALVARADASSALQGLFLALGAIALAVGGIGIANVMVIAVLERRGEIGPVPRRVRPARADRRNRRRDPGRLRDHRLCRGTALGRRGTGPGPVAGHRIRARGRGSGWHLPRAQGGRVLARRGTADGVIRPRPQRRPAARRRAVRARAAGGPRARRSRAAGRPRARSPAARSPGHRPVVPLPGRQDDGHLLAVPGRQLLGDAIRERPVIADDEVIAATIRTPGKRRHAAIIVGARAGDTKTAPSRRRHSRGTRRRGVAL